MRSPTNYLPFDALLVPLQGSNLIEASAGTGKTYSIAILALRLILEDNIAVEQILMVTFTKAAVSELQERVRLFIRLGLKHAEGESIPDEKISALVQHAIANSGAGLIRDRLKDAVLLLDEISIMTIHSFCQQTLNEFAFETGQLFGAKMFTDLDAIVEQEVNAFWREYITTMDVDLLNLLGYEALRQDIRAIVKEQLEGKHYAGYETGSTYTLNDLSLKRYKECEATVRELAVQYQERVLESFLQHRAEITAVCNTSKARNKKDYINALEDPASFLDLLHNGKENVLTKALPVAFLSIYNEAQTFIEQAAMLIRLNFKSGLYFFAIQEVIRSIRYFLLKNNLLGYNDLIQNLYQALTQKDNPALVKAMQDKYKAVFVDEFQDTDREQYEIFRTAFPKPTIMFLIGDPKQSIYAWRKADIFTYFTARALVDQCYSMNINYRSAAPLIGAMNRFFLPEKGFDTFYFEQEAQTIEYFPVESPDGNSKGMLYYGEKPDVPISILECKNKDAIQLAVAEQIQALLTDNAYRIDMRGISPSDIGILVRKNADGEGIKTYLAQRGIPAVILNDAKVLGTLEAQELLYLLEAILEPGITAINRALLSGFTGFNTSQILELNEESVLAYFQQYKTTWTEDGIYPALMRFVKEFNIRERLIAGQSGQGERVVANLFQLIELLNQAQQYRELSPEELISWLKRGINGMETQGDEYQVRIERDEEAVKIITIHKSKGLEYKIVFAPFLDMNADSSFKILKYRDPVTGHYIAKESLRLTPEEKAWNIIQQEQENRRLIYVALTRGVYKCFVYKNLAAYYKNSSLSVFTRALKQAGTDPSEMNMEEAPRLQPQPYRKTEEAEVSRTLFPAHFSLKEENWSKLSYTRISLHGETIPKERIRDFEDAYDDFVYSKLRFGAATGNLLHQLFEVIDFSKEDYWDDIIARTLKSYLPAAGEAYTALIRRLLEHVVKAPIRLGFDHFSLSEIPYYKRISELEFDFPISGLKTAQLAVFGGEGKEVYARSFEGKAQEGIMNGKIDLFFEHRGRFYILDWKSNYLGYKPEDYDKDALLAGMNENNYHLQYLLYTVAVKKYLHSRIPDFDYEKHFGGIIYLFLRGVRQDSNSGIFTARPSLKKIEAIEELMIKSQS